MSWTARLRHAVNQELAGGGSMLDGRGDSPRSKVHDGPGPDKLTGLKRGGPMQV